MHIAQHPLWITLNQSSNKPSINYYLLGVKPFRGSHRLTEMIFVIAEWSRRVDAQFTL
jgi:hypothetical protein